MEKKIHLPNFFVLGPPKSASSSLYFYLNQHPDIFMSTKKETRFFDLDYENGLSFYARYFKDVTKEIALGEATPTYSFLPFVAARISKEFPYAKLIFSFGIRLKGLIPDG